MPSKKKKFNARFPPVGITIHDTDIITRYFSFTSYFIDVLGQNQEDNAN